ncbi:MAG TPA: restriction endonuclease subunit S [Bacteroidia bacterium]|nr:restriction endonuclease subunit S [Bacteroidia bacterium]
MKTETTIQANPKIQQSEKSPCGQYATYKPSNVEWLGDVPSHWKIERIKDIAIVVLGKMLCSEDLGGYHLKPYLKSKNVGWNELLLENNTEEMWFSEKELENFRVKKGDILMTEGGEVGKTAIWNDEIPECYLQNSVHKITFDKKNYSRYYLYQLNHIGLADVFKNIVSQVSIGHLTKEKLVVVKVLTPPLPEQTAIAAYLDQATANIDKVIATKQKQLEKLEQYKQSKIHECVTKGLNHDVKGLKDDHDFNSKKNNQRKNHGNHTNPKNQGADNMRPSGIDWIGDVPGHWKVEKIKRRLSFVYGSALKEEDRVDGQFNVYGSNGIVGTHDYAITDGETIIIGRKGTAGALNYSYEPCYPIDTAYFIDKTSTEANIRFLYYALQTLDLDKMNEDSAVPGLSRENAYQKQLAFPPRVEQKELADYLDNFCDKISKEKSIIDQQIEKLKQYRKCLIHECVTGKRKVVNDLRMDGIKAKKAK